MAYISKPNIAIKFHGFKNDRIIEKEEVKEGEDDVGPLALEGEDAADPLANLSEDTAMKCELCT